MKVVEIFNSIEGEGKRVGKPCTFIRLFGCNLRCKYCDSLYAVESGSSYEEMSVEDILQKVQEYGCPSVTVTGGEPLIHKGINVLLSVLATSGYEVNVETNGTVEPRYYLQDRVFYTVDYKTDASGESSKMNPRAFRLQLGDVIKCVVGSEEDMKQSLAYLKLIGADKFPNIYLSPVFGMIEPVKLVEFVKENKLWNWSVQLQIHKVIWDPQKKGV